jgi:hypothetical protein
MKELRKTRKNLVQSSKPLTVDCESKRITVALSLSVVTVLKVRFQVLTAASMKMAVFWVVAPCSLPRTRLHDATTQNTAI